MSVIFEKSDAKDSQVWADSITGYRTSVFSTEGQIDRGSIGILAQQFHPQNLNWGPYFRLQILLDRHQIDELIQKLESLKNEMP